MVIYMDRYRAVKAAPAAWLKNGTDGNAVMQAGWSPAVVQILRKPDQEVSVSPELPRDMSNVDIDAFLGRVYGLATLI